MAVWLAVTGDAVAAAVALEVAAAVVDALAPCVRLAVVAVLEDAVAAAVVLAVAAADTDALATSVKLAAGAALDDDVGVAATAAVAVADPVTDGVAVIVALELVDCVTLGDTFGDAERAIEPVTDPETDAEGKGVSIAVGVHDGEPVEDNVMKGDTDTLAVADVDMLPVALAGRRHDVTTTEPGAPEYNHVPWPVFGQKAV